MRTALIFLVTIIFSGTVKLFSQEKDIFLELGGSGGLGSVNFEKWRLPRNKPFVGEYNAEMSQQQPPPISYGIRVGIGTTPVDKNNGWVIVVPVMASLLYKEPHIAHGLEVSAGIAPSVSTKGAWFVRSPLSLGYRFQSLEKRWLLRVAYTPIVSWLVDFQCQHWAGISVGYQFQHER